MTIGLSGQPKKHIRNRQKRAFPTKIRNSPWLGSREPNAVHGCGPISGESLPYLDGCVEVEAAYYSAPPGWIGRQVQVQWDGKVVRLLDPRNGQLLREHLRGERGRHRIKDEDRPHRTPIGVVQLLARMATAGEHIGQFCKLMHAQQGELAVRRIQGILSFTKKYGIARVEDACAAALELEAIDYRFVRRYLERSSQPPITLRQVDPLIRQLNLYRDLIEERTKEEEPKP